MPGRAKKYLRPSELAKRLGVSGDTVRHWIRTGKLKAHTTPGGHYRIPISEAKRIEKKMRAGAFRRKRKRGEK